MEESEASRAIAAAISTATSLGLKVDDSIVLHNSNKLTVRLRPCEVVARVAPAGQQVAQFEVDLVRRLLVIGSPVAALETRVSAGPHHTDGFVITLWTYHEPVESSAVPAIAYANALLRLHAGMRNLNMRAPHFTDRVAEAQQLLASRERTPALDEEDRNLLAVTLETLGDAISGRGDDQLLHGEPHPGNVLSTSEGPLFVDFETCCRGPIEFDVAHAPPDVADHYPNVDPVRLRECRILVLAMVTTWRWDRTDQFPNGRKFGVDGLAQLRKKGLASSRRGAARERR